MVRKRLDKEAKQHPGLITCGQRKKQKWDVEETKLDNAGRLLGIFFIDPADAESNGTVDETSIPVTPTPTVT